MRALLCFVIGLSAGLVLRRRPPERHDDGLSPRQRQVLALVGDGRTTKEIADRLGLTDASVRTHVRRARLRLGAPNRAAAVAALAHRSTLST